MPDKNNMVVGAINFGPAHKEGAPRFSGLSRVTGKMPWTGPTIKCLVKACPNNKKGACSSPSSISINVNGVCNTAVMTQTIVPKE